MMWRPSGVHTEKFPVGPKGRRVNVWREKSHDHRPAELTTARVPSGERRGTRYSWGGAVIASSCPCRSTHASDRDWPRSIGAYTSVPCSEMLKLAAWPTVIT